MSPETPADYTIRIFRQEERPLRTREALDLGIHPRTLYALRDAGVLETLSRGLYRLADLPPLTNPDLVTVARRVPRGVICLISALAFHELTTQVPHAVDVALRPGDEQPRLDYPPLRVYRFSKASWAAGIETHRLDGTEVRIYAAAKSVADAFKFRHKIGMDIVLEALRTHLQRPGFDLDALLSYARICRVEKVMHPYLEALL
ncbi:MAG: type IV toxin-antitoxin system AbiEi family antitoxin domain-containing protein [Anaerolineae bacterium]